ncbi:speckle targeted PIP5K1A-regulated poly(A) polymerase-like [Hetaerina americana]|uniref:speckle targeted PIP5K1A-regulated poly(A) polymerase-like n=1 Tax=Hetaerina americana TaxID=62018 RepID=UPI003A7F23D7
MEEAGDNGEKGNCEKLVQLYSCLAAASSSHSASFTVHVTQTVGHTKTSNPPTESDFYCKLCDVDCINSSGKLLHSLDANHIEAYLAKQKRIPGRIPMCQAESDIKSKWKETASSKANVLEHSRQHSVCIANIGDPPVSHETKRNVKSKSKKKRSSKKNITLYNPLFLSSLLNSQSSDTTATSGLTVNDTESNFRNNTFEQVDNDLFPRSLTQHSCNFNSKNGKNLEENIFPVSTSASKDLQGVDSIKAVPDDLVKDKEVSFVDHIDDKFKALCASSNVQKGIVDAANNVKEDLVTELSHKPPDIDNCKRIIIEGFSAGDDKNCIARQFSKYGFIKSQIFYGATIHIEYFEWQSVERLFAELTNGTITIDGKEILVKKNRNKPKKGLQIEKIPEKLKNLFSIEDKFISQVTELLENFQLDLREVGKQQVACESILSSLKKFAPKIYPYGSRISGLASKNSDFDIFVFITKPYKYFKKMYLRHTQELIIHEAAHSIRSSGDFRNVVKIPKALVPLIRCQHLPTGLKCDLTFRYPYQVYNTGLIITFMSIDHRVRPLILLIRYWANTHGFLGRGKFTSYSLTLMCIFYLQQIPNYPVLPSVSLLMKLARDNEKASYGLWNCGYCEDISLIPKLVNDSSLFHLVKGFFKFFAEFDAENMVVCPFLGKAMLKSIFLPGKEHLLPVEFENYKSNCRENLTEPLKVDHVLCIQDPFIHDFNVARLNHKDVVESFQLCCYLYTQEQNYEDELCALSADAMNQKKVSDSTKIGTSQIG